jgi:hypothetical protein
MAEQPTGPEAYEGDETVARDGEPSADELARRRKARDGSPLGEREEEEVQIPDPPMLEGDRQLTLAGLGRRGVPIESRVSLMSASVPIDGQLDPDREGVLRVSYEPAGYDYVPVRDTDAAGARKVVRWKLVQKLRPVHIIRDEVSADAPEEGAG